MAHKIVAINCATGKVTERDATEAQVAAREAGRLALVAERAAAASAPDPDAELLAAIESAGSLDELKAALLGKLRAARVAGRSL